MQKIGEVMMTDVLTAEKHNTVFEMSEKLQKHRIGAIVIIDSRSHPIGIVSERDIIQAIVVYKENAVKKQAQDIMSAPVMTLEPEDDIEAAALLMQNHTIRRIPIAQNNVLVGIISYRDITNALRKSYFTLEKERGKLEDRANRDPLTGLYNRGYLNKQLSYHFELAQRSGNPMALMMLDIDHFKKINDEFGHQCGDKVLKKLADIFLDKSRAINIVARYGGEEFTIIGPISDYKSSQYMAERFRVMIENEKFKCGDKTFSITISIGIAIWNPGIKNEHELLKLADEALYTAKRNGRNQVHIAETG
ncbi:MAG: diguanylate cyclase [Candidatus Goldiibacteriota bacterium]